MIIERKPVLRHILTRLRYHAPALSALVLIAVVLLRANPFAGETLAPFDLLVHQPAWWSIEPKPPVVHVQHSDVLDYKLPAWFYLKRALRGEDSLTWDPFTAAGAQGMQLLTRSGMTPAFALFAWLDNDAWGLYAAALCNLLILGFGAYFFFHALSGQRSAALLGAIVLSYSGFIAGWFYWPHVNTAIWLPWLLLYGLRYAESGARRYLPRFALVSVLLLLGGFPVIFVYAYLALGLLLSFRLASLRLGWRMRGTRLAGLGLFVLLSLSMSAFAIAALAEYLGRIDLSYRHGGTALTQLSDLWLFLQPFSDEVLWVERSAYAGLFPVAALGISLYWLARRRADWRIAWAVSLIGVSLIFVFALLPAEWLMQVPLIGRNPWSRMLLLIHLGLAALAVVVYQRLWRWSRKRLPHVAFLLLIIGIPLLQIADEGRVFMRRVAPVDGRLVYPETPAIAVMQADTAPLQNVLGDLGFLVSGTLSAYGLPEWFAHEMRPAAEKRILEKWLVRNAFVTPTAARFTCGQVRFDSRGLDYFGVRYIACIEKASYGERKLLDTLDGAGGEWSTPLNVDGLTQHFHIDAAFSPYRFVFPVHPAESPEASWSLSIRRGGDEKLGETRCMREKVRWECRFDSALRLPPGDYRLFARTTGKGPRLAYRMSNAPGAHLDLADGQQDAMLRMQVYTKLDQEGLPSSIDGSRFERLDPEPGARLYRNRNVSGSIYALRGDGIPDYRTVLLSDYRAGHLVIDYIGDGPAWVVVPMRLLPGWHARVRGLPARISRFLDIMPAVHVDGPARIRLDYRPSGYPALLAISLAAWLVWGVAAWRWR